MRRISTATKVVDKWGAGKPGFTDGNAVTGIPATDLEAVFFDNVQEEICGVIEAAGLTVDGSSMVQLLTAVRQLSAGVVGSRGLTAQMAAAGTSLTINGVETVMKSALGGLAYLDASWSDTINTGTVGAGGMDIGTAPNNGFLAVYRIYNPTTKVKKLLGTNATSTAAPEVYAGANMPSGYTASALVSVWPTNGSGQFIVANQRDRRIAFPLATLLNTNTTQAVFTALSIAGAVPKNAVRMTGKAQVGSSTTSGAQGVVLASGSNGAGACEISLTGLVLAGYFDLLLPTQQTIYYTLNGTSGIGLSLYCNSYDF